MFTCGFLRSNFSLAISARPSWLVATESSLAEFRWVGLADAVGDAARGSARGLGDHLFADALRRLLVGIELHGVGRPPLAARAQVGGVAEHLGERHLGGDHLRRAARLHVLDPAAARGEV